MYLLHCGFQQISGHYSARIGISLLQLTHVIIDSLETITLANPPHRPFFPFRIVAFTVIFFFQNIRNKKELFEHLANEHIIM